MLQIFLFSIFTLGGHTKTYIDLIDIGKVIVIIYIPIVRHRGQGIYSSYAESGKSLRMRENYDMVMVVSTHACCDGEYAKTV